MTKNHNLTVGLSTLIKVSIKLFFLSKLLAEITLDLRKNDIERSKSKKLTNAKKINVSKIQEKDEGNEEFAKIIVGFEEHLSICIDQITKSIND